VDDVFLKSISGEVGGSERIGPDELQRILMSVGEFTTKAGGSAANTARGLAHGGVGSFFSPSCSFSFSSSSSSSSS
jgi:sugar/nucleoside kinase (ribokinase family)